MGSSVQPKSRRIEPKSLVRYLGSLVFKSFTETNRSFLVSVKILVKFFEYFQLVRFEILVNLVRAELTDHRTENQSHYLIIKNKLKT